MAKEGNIGNKWTAEEIYILRQNYAKYGIAATAALLPRHPYDSVRTKAYLLGITKQQRGRYLCHRRAVIAYTDEGCTTYPDVPAASQHYGISNKTLYGLIASGNVREGVSFDYLTD